MDFPKALAACMAGSRITNENWNGKGMYVFMMPGYMDGVPANSTLAMCAGIHIDDLVKISPYLMMKNAKAEFVPWLISNMDVFSTCWKIVED